MRKKYRLVLQGVWSTSHHKLGACGFLDDDERFKSVLLDDWSVPGSRGLACNRARMCVRIEMMEKHNSNTTCWRVCVCVCAGILL